MSTITIKAPSLSFKPETIAVSKESEYAYKIHADGWVIGTFYGSNEDYIVISYKYEFTNADKVYLRDIVEKLRRLLMVETVA